MRAKPHLPVLLLAVGACTVEADPRPKLGERDLHAAMDLGANSAVAEAGCGAPRTLPYGPPGLITIAGDPGDAPAGFGDPSLVYPSGAAIGYLSYTAVGPSAASTRIARSTDAGAHWTYVSSVNAITPLTISTSDDAICGSASCDGSWVHETSSLLDDPSDPDPARRYKVFAHSYFITREGAQRYEIGSIDVWTTAALVPGATFRETRLLGWTSSSPRSSTGVAQVVTRDPALTPGLGSCVALTEPGAFAMGGRLYLALGCVRYQSATSLPIDVRLIRSSDHGRTWESVGTLLSTADAIALGASGQAGPQLNGADLFEVGGQVYVFATPNGPVTNVGTATSGYRGCYVFPVADLDRAAVARCGDKLDLRATLLAGPGVFHGACTYRPGASAAGVMVLSADFTRAPAFQLGSTGLALP